MRSCNWRSFWLSIGAVAGVLAVACGSDTLVGGGCREGLSECSLKCVDLGRDPKNCGACGRRCGAGEICAAGVCGVDTGAGDAGSDVASSDVAAGDGAFSDG